MLCRVCSKDFPNLSALLQHQSITECGSSLTAAASAPTQAPSIASPAQPSPECVIALDCEMVAVEGTKHGMERSALARVAVVDWSGRVLLDTFVKPGAKVRDERAREL